MKSIRRTVWSKGDIAFRESTLAGVILSVIFERNNINLCTIATLFGLKASSFWRLVLSHVNMYKSKAIGDFAARDGKHILSGYREMPIMYPVNGCEQQHLLATQ